MRLNSKTKWIFITSILIISAIIILQIFIFNSIEVAKITIEEVINKDSNVFNISEEDKDKIIKFYQSVEKFNLPYPVFKYNKTVKLDTLVNQDILIKRHSKMSNGNYQVSFNFSFDVYDSEKYKEGKGYVSKDSYQGIVFFELSKKNFNTWKIEKVKISKVTPVINGVWHSNYE